MAARNSEILDGGTTELGELRVQPIALSLHGKGALFDFQGVQQRSF